jgi:N-acetyl-1-D-myo-inositol-2-amino-2-deoxy-alpha-D-glucopyranoside deacetylase
MHRRDTYAGKLFHLQEAQPGWRHRNMSLSPEIFAVNAHTRLLVIAPHPDDETIGTGELIQRVREVRGSVRVLLLTDGDNNPWPQRWLEKRLWIRPQDRARWGCRRREEMARALHTLGVRADALHTLGWSDMGLTDGLRTDSAAMLAPLVAQLGAFGPNLIALPALGDHHPDHGSAHVLARLALQRWGGSAQLISYLIHGQPDVAALPVELAPDYELHANKLVALETHRSQMALSGPRMRRLTDRPERYTTLAARTDRTRGTLPWRPPLVWRHWLRLLVADGAGVRSWRWNEAPLERDGDGRYRLLGASAEGPRFAKLYLGIPSPWIFDRWGWCEI